MGRARALWLLLSIACGSPPAPSDPLAWIAVGVDPELEARAVAHNLGEAGFRIERTVRVDGAVGLELRTEDDRRAIRIVTSRGVVSARDSLAEDGVRERDGRVRLVELERADVDADGSVELAIEREDTGCLELVRIAPDGRASGVRLGAGALRTGACVTALRDVDARDGLEAIVTLAWPELALGERAPSIDVPLFAREGAYEYEPPPVSYLGAERERRTAELEAIRARRDLAEANRLGVELAALANLEGASFISQAEWHDRALAGIVLDAAQRTRVAEVRAFVVSGWRDTR